MLILNSLKESVERPGVVGTRGLLAEVGYSRSAGRSRLLHLKKLVDASRRRGVVRIALSSPEWGGPKGENRKERDGTSECYRWLAKCDLMTKTGYGYAKCLTVAGTATPLVITSKGVTFSGNVEVGRRLTRYWRVRTASNQ